MNNENVAFWFLPDETSLNNTIERYKVSQGISFSSSFLLCANYKLFFAFQLQFSKRPSKTSTVEGVVYFYKNVGIPSDILDSGVRNGNAFLKCSFSINGSFNPITICWKSKTGRIYETSDEDIDCNDIEFWFEDLDVAKVHELLHPKQTIPLALKNLNFKLELNNLNTNLELVAFLKSEFSDQIVDIANKTCDFVNEYNKVSERSSNEERGFVHYIKFDVEDSCIKFLIDSGSAGMPFLKQLLRTFSKWNAFEKVIID